MSYDYQTERPKLFTEEGQVMLLKIRDNVEHCIKTSGAVMMGNAWKGVTGDGWTQMACVDRLVELGELAECQVPGSGWAQHRVFVRPNLGR